MLVIISPARQFSPPEPPYETTRARFLDEAAQLASILRDYDPWQLEGILRCNPELALEASAQYRRFDPAAPGSPALQTYRGLCYRYLEPALFGGEDLAWASEHIRIGSALYGLLRASDGVQPYRLELISRLKVDGANLYRFWGDKVYRALFERGDVVLDLASKEYAGLVTPHLTGREAFISCDFLVPHRGGLRTKATLAKMARGRMVQWIIKNRVDNPDALRAFTWDGYTCNKRLSTPRHMVFVREES